MLRPLRAFGPPMLDAVQPMPFPEMQRILDGAFPDGTHNHWKASFVPKLGDELIEILVEHANRMRSPLSALLIEYYAGAPGRVPAAESAFAQRGSEFNIWFTAQWTDPAETAEHVAWARAAFDAVAPYSSGTHALNFQSEAGEEVVRSAFGGNYARLAEVKRKYDPGNFFSVNANIVPEGSVERRRA